MMKQKKMGQKMLKKLAKTVILCLLDAAAAPSRQIRLGIGAHQPRDPSVTGQTNLHRAPRHATTAAVRPITARPRGWTTRRLRPVGSAPNRVTTRGARLGGIRVWSPAPHLRGPTHHHPIMSRTLRLVQLRDPLCRHPRVRHALWPQKIPPVHVHVHAARHCVMMAYLPGSPRRSGPPCVARRHAACTSPGWWRTSYRRLMETGAGPRPPDRACPP